MKENATWKESQDISIKRLLFQSFSRNEEFGRISIQEDIIEKNLKMLV